MINPETITKDQTKREFARFVEDYNTATLAHAKFYDIAAHDARMAALRAGEFLPPPDDGYDPDADLRALQSAHKRKNVERDTYMSKEQLEELRQVRLEAALVPFPDERLGQHFVGSASWDVLLDGRRSAHAISGAVSLSGKSEYDGGPLVY